MALVHKQTITVEEYFQLEENNHDIIKSNIQMILWNLLRGSECCVFSSTMKVYMSETRNVHPDVIVTLDHRDRGTVQAILFPRLVVEVVLATLYILLEETVRRRSSEMY